MESIKKILTLLGYATLAILIGLYLSSSFLANHLTIKEKLLTAELMEVCLAEGAQQEVNLTRVKAICHSVLIGGGQ